MSNEDTFVLNNILGPVLQEARHLDLMEAIEDDVTCWTSYDGTQSQIEISGLVTKTGQPLLFRYE
jgi:hypothetical protein